MPAIRGNGLQVERLTQALRGSPPVLCRSCGRQIETFAAVHGNQTHIRLWRHVDLVDCCVGVPWNAVDADRRLARQAGRSAA